MAKGHLGPGPLSTRLLAQLTALAQEAARKPTPAESLALADSPASIEQQLRAALSDARAAWPGVILPDDAFLDHLGCTLARAEQHPRSLTKLHLQDIYLVGACLRRVAGAAEAIEAACLVPLRRVLGAMQLPAGIIEEALQSVRAKLFVGSGDHPPLLDSYAGRGALRSWLRSIAVHTALDLVEQSRKAAPLVEDEVLFDAAVPQSNPELAHLRGSCAALLRQALASALAALPTRDRNLLRQHILDGLTVDELAPLYRVHRATVSRWILQARASLLKGIRRYLRKHARLGQGSVSSLVGLAGSRLELSLSQFWSQQEAAGR